MQMHVLDSLVQHNQVDQNMELPVNKFYVLLIFQYHDATIQCVDLLAQQLLRLNLTVSVKHHEPQDAQVQNLL